MNKPLATLGVLLVSGSALWFFGLSHRWTDRITPGWKWSGSYIGIGTAADPETGELPERDVVVTYEHLIEVVPGSWQAGAVVLRDRYITRNITSGQGSWEYSLEAPVDPKTGAHLRDEFRGDQLVFPRNVERTKSYSLRYSYVKGLPLAFETETSVEGLRTFVFSYKGAAEYTESYANTKEVLGVDVEPGQEIRCLDDQFRVRAWVEPTTGEIVKIEESCYSGDAVYDIETGETLHLVGRWGGVSAGDDVIRRAERIRAARRRYLVAAWYLPGALLLGGLLVLGVAVRRRMRSR